MDQSNHSISDAAIIKHMTYVGLAVFATALAIAWVANAVA